ncbi:helix-turn-helix transcriptional regulator [Enterococcus rotai]|uniref:helix-turn-helix transcriptional regulator n=1 Tax=Enterococcus rotai TaxID=118060 RepID=UPI0032B52882
MKNYLREYRKSAIMSKEELGKRSGCSAQTIESIEKEKYEPSLFLACRIAREVGRPLDKVFCLEVKGWWEYV